MCMFVPLSYEKGQKRSPSAHLSNIGHCSCKSGQSDSQGFADVQWRLHCTSCFNIGRSFCCNAVILRVFCSLWTVTKANSQHSYEQKNSNERTTRSTVDI